METNSTRRLFDYGIQNEQSDIRVHVCPLVQRVYVYPTAEGQRVVESGCWPKRPAYQPGVAGPTAEGYCVPPFAIRRCVAVTVRPEAWTVVDLREGESTSEKGAKAVCLVNAMIYNGILPLPYTAASLDADPSKALQIRGDDIIVQLGASSVHIQVKCDFKGGDRTRGGTGNLYLQVAERNPLGLV